MPFPCVSPSTWHSQIHWEDRDTADKAGSPVSDGAAYAADARAVGPKHDLSPEHMQVGGGKGEGGRERIGEGVIVWVGV